MVEVLDWNNHPNPETAVRQISDALVQGQLVVLPRESTYVLAGSANHPQAISAILDFHQKSALDTPPSLAVLNVENVANWLPDLSPIVLRLLRRCWPGTLELMPTSGEHQILTQLFPEGVRDRIAQPQMTLCSPEHAAVLYPIHLTQCPLLCVSTGKQQISETDELATLASVLCDDGPRSEQLAPTVFRVNADNLDVVRQGALTLEQLQEQLGHLILFVCTGNTCRSPLAQVLCEKLLVENLSCEAGQLAKNGFLVRSAGISAYDGSPASPESVTIAQKHGVDLSRHASRPLTASLVQQADSLLCMTGSHLEMIRTYFPEEGGHAEMLSPAGTDLIDPIGQDEAFYDQCAEQILNDLKARLSQWVKV